MFDVARPNKWFKNDIKRSGDKSSDLSPLSKLTLSNI